MSCSDIINNYEAISNLVPFPDFDVTAYMTFDNVSDLTFDFIQTPMPTPEIIPPSQVPVPNPTPIGTLDLLPSATGFTTTITTTHCPLPGYTLYAIFPRALQAHRDAIGKLDGVGMPPANKYDMDLAIIDMLEQWHGRNVPELMNIKRQLLCLSPISPNIDARWYQDRFREIDEAISRFLGFQRLPPAPIQIPLTAPGCLPPIPGLSPIQVLRPRTTFLEATQRVIAGATPQGVKEIKHVSFIITDVVQHLTLLKIGGPVRVPQMENGNKEQEDKMEASLALRRSQRQLEAKARKEEVKQGEETPKENSTPSKDFNPIDNIIDSVVENAKKRALKRRAPAAGVEEKLILVDNRPRMLFRRKLAAAQKEKDDLGQAPILGSPKDNPKVETGEPKKKRKRTSKLALSPSTGPSTGGMAENGSGKSNSKISKSVEGEGTKVIPPPRKRGRPLGKKNAKNGQEAQIKLQN